MCSSKVGETEHSVSAVSSWDTWQGFLGCLPDLILLCMHSTEQPSLYHISRQEKKNNKVFMKTCQLMNGNFVMAEAPPPCYNCHPKCTQQQSRSKLIGSNALRCALLQGPFCTAQGNGDYPRPQQTTRTGQSHHTENMYYLRDSGTQEGKTHTDPPLPLGATSPECFQTAAVLPGMPSIEYMCAQPNLVLQMSQFNTRNLHSPYRLFLNFLGFKLLALYSIWVQQLCSHARPSSAQLD